jgi:hypothetical protein
MGVNHLFELRQFLLARRTLQGHDSFDPGKPGAHVTDREKPTQVEDSIELDRDAFEGNPKRRRIKRGR